ncbi:MAG TPA: helix-turn-helix transcriptional regulator [Oscillospiraceae bacterium]|nr:helix-turn-helix transcriptional regulator [Oscillospiraceae bacterium]
MNAVAKNIKKLRLGRKLTQEDLAQALFVTRQTVSNWENGKSQPDIDSLVKIAEALGTDAAALIYGPPSSEARTQEIVRFAVSGGVLLVLCAAFHVLAPLAVKMARERFIILPQYLLGLYYLPLLWFVAGFTVVQGLGILGAARPLRWKHRKVLRIAALAIVLLYAGLLLPFSTGLLRSLVEQLRYKANPALFPNGLQNTLHLPYILNQITSFLSTAVSGRAVVFAIPGAAFWLGGAAKEERKDA